VRFRLRGYSAYASNITPDPNTGIGKWSDADIIRALRQGRRPDGSRIGGMPFELYRDISDRDALAIAAHLRSLKPVRNPVPRVGGGRARPRTDFVPRKVPEAPRGDPVRYGAYLAGPVGRCIECHTPSRNGGGPDYQNMLGAGGTIFTGPWGEAIAGNITPDPDTGLGEFSDGQIRKMIVEGLRPDRTTVGRPMAHTYYRKLTEEDLDAIVAYLRSLRPIKNFIDK
jgi:mono/diheme cytochrome c family protein